MRRMRAERRFDDLAAAKQAGGLDRLVTASGARLRWFWLVAAIRRRRRNGCRGRQRFAIQPFEPAA